MANPYPLILKRVSTAKFPLEVLSIVFLVKEAALEKYNAALTDGKEVLISGSDDFTMILWSPETSNKPIARLTGKFL